MENVQSVGSTMSASEIKAMHAERFDEADEDGDGSINEEELQGVLDKISLNGESLSAEDLMAEYDEDEDGVLSEEEMTTAMEALREETEAEAGKGGPPPPPPKEAAASYAANAGDTTTSSLLDLISGEEEDDDTSTLIESLLDGQTSGTLSGSSAAVDLLA